jgi:photosystem II stability/assembly factor-like uncharacterized protein
VDIDLLSPELALLIADKDKVFRSSDLGRSWSPTGANPPGFLSAILAFDENTWIAVGTPDLIYRTTDAGVSWAVVHSVASQTTQIDLDRFPGTQTVVAISSKTVRLSTDAGASWGDPLTLVGLEAVACADERVAVAVGSAGFFRTADQGASWELVEAPSERLRAVAFISPLHGFAAAEGGTIWETLDGGANWERRRLSVRDFHCLAARADAGIVAGGEGGIVVQGSAPAE